jgi:PEP-CTERM motif
LALNLLKSLQPVFINLLFCEITHLEKENNMKRIILALATLALTASLANATSILNGGYIGPITIKYSNFETLITAGGQTLSGIFNVTSILAANSSQTVLWSSGQNGQQLTGDFNGLVSQAPIVNGGTTTINFTGGFTDLYLGPNTGAGAFDATSPGTIGAAQAIASALINFVPGIVPTSSTITFSSQLNQLTAPFTGHGAGYGVIASTTGNFLDYLNLDPHLLFESDLKATGSDVFGWSVTSQDPVTGTVVPEPGTLALLGIGLLGMAIYGKRRMNA